MLKVGLLNKFLLLFCKNKYAYDFDYNYTYSLRYKTLKGVVYILEEKYNTAYGSRCPRDKAKPLELKQKIKASSVRL